MVWIYVMHTYSRIYYVLKWSLFTRVRASSKQTLNGPLNHGQSVQLVALYYSQGCSPTCMSWWGHWLLCSEGIVQQNIHPNVKPLLRFARIIVLTQYLLGGTIQSCIFIITFPKDLYMTVCLALSCIYTKVAVYSCRNAQSILKCTLCRQCTVSLSPYLFLVFSIGY